MMRYDLMTIVASACALAAGLCAATSGFGEDGKAVAYISNQKDGVTVLGLDQLTPVREIEPEAKEPRGIGVTADGRYLLTANNDRGDVSVVDTASAKVIKHIPIGKNPEFVRVQGDFAYVTFEPSVESGPPGSPGGEKHEEEEANKAPAQIAVVDLKDWRIVRTIVSGRETEGIEFSPDGKRMLVTNEGDNTITVYELSTGELNKTIDTSSYGNRPRGIKVSPDGQLYAVTLEFSSKLLVLDRELRVLKAVSTGKGPYGVAFDRQGKRLFVAAAGNKQLQVFDAQTFAPIIDIPVGDRCWHFSFTPDDSRILVACGRSNNLYVIDANTYQPVKTISGLKAPWGVVTYPKAIGSLDKP
jgi:YVTN family beta-propeller protein